MAEYNTNADALSRVNEPGKADKKIKNNVTKLANASEDKFRAELKVAQSEDSELRHLFDSNSKDFMVVDGLLFKAGSKRTRLVVPQSLVAKCLCMCHNDMGGGLWDLRKHGLK